MKREMFGEVVEPSITVGNRRWYTLPLSVLTHVVVFAAVAIVPLLATDMLPTPQSVLAFAVVPAAPAVPPPPAPAPDRRPTLTVSRDAAPVQAPSVINLDPPPAPPRGYSLSDAVGAVTGGMPDGTSGGLVALPARPPAPAPQVTGPVRPGGDVNAPTKIRDARPVYPAIAIAANVEGAVVIEAILTKEGTVRDAKVLRSVPLLDQAALDAVRQWRYTPTTLNGVPVEVIMSVTVVFTLR